MTRGQVQYKWTWRSNGKSLWNIIHDNTATGNSYLKNPNGLADVIYFNTFNYSIQALTVHLIRDALYFSTLCMIRIRIGHHMSYLRTRQLMSILIMKLKIQAILPSSCMKRITLIGFGTVLHLNIVSKLIVIC